MRPRPRTAVGSSPLTRGKPQIVQLVGQVGGLIPAHAGKTHRPLRRAIRSAAHPRSRGENTPLYLRLALTAGSSPLTRGKRRRCWSAFQSVRLIPAHAGKTPPARPSPSLWPAHPRSRGENKARATPVMMTDGSSPLTRGKPVPSLRTPPADGLIPAHAGKTGDGDAHGRCTRAHPRSRGENRRPHGIPLCRVGSSPLTRGKLRQLVHFFSGNRLIPAHAGKTPFRHPARQARGAHPRSRGENQPCQAPGRPVLGSSPLTRGKLRLTEFTHYSSGLIPAHAGKTHDRHPRLAGRAAHPRSRGENTIREDIPPVDNGSSPLTRGKPLR